MNMLTGIEKKMGIFVFPPHICGSISMGFTLCSALSHERQMSIVQPFEYTPYFVFFFLTTLLYLRISNLAEYPSEKNNQKIYAISLNVRRWMPVIGISLLSLSKIHNAPMQLPLTIWHFIPPAIDTLMIFSTIVSTLNYYTEIIDYIASHQKKTVRHTT